MNRVFLPSEIARVFSVPPEVMGQVMTRQFRGSEVAALYRVPDAGLAESSAHKRDQDSADPEIATCEKEKKGEAK